MGKVFKDIEKLNVEDLRSRLDELQIELLKLRAQSVSGAPPKNVMQLRNTKKLISKIKMLIAMKSSQS